MKDKQVTATKKPGDKLVKKVAAPVGKPIAYDASLGDEICQLIAEGVPLREICRMEKMPSWWNAYEWMKADLEFGQRIARAREIGFDVIAAESMDIVDAPPERTMTGQIDSGSVAHAKLRAEHRLKLLAKWSPKRYGDKVENTVIGADGGPVLSHLTLEFVKTK